MKRNTSKNIVGKGCAVRSTELDTIAGKYKVDADKARARLAVSHVLVNEYLKLRLY